jgi:hypothetical protein
MIEILCNNILLCFPYLIAGFVGAIVASIELATRFSDDIKAILKNHASRIYLFINLISSMIIFSLLYNADISISNMKIIDHPYVSSVIIGLLSMGILRSSFLNIQLQNKSIDAGLYRTIDMLLHWAEAMYDRNKSSRLVKEVTPIVKGVKFESMYKAIIPTSMVAFTNLSLQDSDMINEVMKKLQDENNLPDNTKVIQLAIGVAKITGVNILKECVDAYRDEPECLGISRDPRMETLESLKKHLFDNKPNYKEEKNEKSE